MLPKMRYRLGLDLGSSSIGWCMIRLGQLDHPFAVIRAGVRIFPDGRNPKDGSSLAVTRRLARQARRRRDRLLKRKQRLLDALVRLDFLPADPKERKALTALDPYVLRKKGLDEPLTAAEFGRAVFHLNQRRGFLSNRKTDRKDSDSGILKEAIKTLRMKLEAENCRTLGEWLANRHEQRLSVRARLRGSTKKDRAYDFYADRAMIEHEFDTLWARQAVSNPELFAEAARIELKGILLFQRPLRPVVPGRCTLLPDEQRAPLALPSVQRFRIYQEVNNLRILQPDLREEPLTRAQRDTVASLLERGDKTFDQITRALKLPGTTQYNLQDGKRDKLKGNSTAALLAKKDLVGPAWHSLSPEAQDEVVVKLLEEADESRLVIWLMDHLGVDEANAERIAGACLPEGHGNLSSQAIARVLPELVNDVIHYAEAVKRAGFVSHSALSHFELTGEVMDALPYYGSALQRHVAFGSGDPADPDEKRLGRIANPTVHIALNEVRKVVNDLIGRYGHPSEVIVEVARDLKSSREERNETQKRQKQNQERNERLVNEACTVLGLEPSTMDRGKRREYSQRMQLWYELNPADPANRRCPYTGEQISITRLLSSEVEIEHILPWSMTLDDSMNNKTVSLRRANRDKGNRTPFDAFGKEPVTGYNFDEMLARAMLMPKAKAKRFAVDGYQQWLRDDKDFLARALNDTRYISRLAREYLSLVCPHNKVRVIPGRMTAMLRRHFGLNSILSPADIKTRDDHRHHAIDAAVVAVTDQGLLQRFATASARAKQNGLSDLVDEVPLPWPTFRDHVARAIDAIVVSHKPDHGYEGAMHEESAWGILEDGTATRRVRPEDGGSRQRERANKKLVEITSTRDPARHGLTKHGEPKAYKGYVGGSNYCIEIFPDDRGKWRGEVISTFKAYQVVRESGEVEGRRRLRDPRYCLSGQPLVLRLMINDLLRLDFPEGRRTMRVAVISGNGQVFLSPQNEANVDARNRDKSDPFQYVSKMAGSLQKANARRVTVSPAGRVREIA